MIHTYSLIHDDLPALDNDDLRRGKPTSHKAFGEATAILAGDALLTLAFESSPRRGRVRRADSKNRESCASSTNSPTPSGPGGMVGGQVVDLESMGKTGDNATLEYIHSAKTAAFIRAAFAPAPSTRARQRQDWTCISTYGEKVGLAFQIADDLLDVLGSKESLGKTVGKDDQQQKPTYPAAPRHRGVVAHGAAACGGG